MPVSNCGMILGGIFLFADISKISPQTQIWDFLQSFQLQTTLTDQTEWNQLQIVD